MATVASSSVAGKTRRMSSSTGREVRTLVPKSPRSTLLEIVQELAPERQVEAQGEARLLVDLGRGAVADHGQHRVDRHHPADQEGDQEQAQEGHGQRERDARHGLSSAAWDPPRHAAWHVIASAIGCVCSDHQEEVHVAGMIFVLWKGCSASAADRVRVRELHLLRRSGRRTRPSRGTGGTVDDGRTPTSPGAAGLAAAGGSAHGAARGELGPLDGRAAAGPARERRRPAAG